MQPLNPQFVTKFAQDPFEFEAAQRLRYDVFVKELGGDGPLVDHDRGLEIDKFDPYFEHLLLYDVNKASEHSMGQVVGVYRILPSQKADQIGRYYSETEYDLSRLKNDKRRLLELGRSCLHKDYRGGAAMFHLWQALSHYVLEQKVDVLFGTASFHGTDIADLAPALSLLHHRYLAPEALRVQVREEHSLSMNIVPEDQISARQAMLKVPSLIKAYLRLGGYVGDGAFIDYAFNTVDVCLIVDIHAMNARQKQIYTRKA